MKTSMTKKDSTRRVGVRRPARLSDQEPGMSLCSECNVEKPDTDFGMACGRPRWQCKACMHTKQREKRRGTQELLNLLKSVPCHDCGVSYPPFVMDFDHRPGTQKHRALSDMLGFALSTVLGEIVKCDVVCANCHRIRTHATRKS